MIDNDYDYGFGKGYEAGYWDGIEEFAEFMINQKYPDALDEIKIKTINSLIEQFKQDYLEAR